MTVKELIIKMIEMDIKEHKKDKTIYVTQVTQCLRKSYYEIISNAIDPYYELAKKFLLGKSMHLWLQSLVRKYGKELKLRYEVEKPIRYKYRGYTIKGRADLIINDTVIEIKTTTKGINIPNIMHILQANEYAYWLSKPQFIILYVTGNDIIEFGFKTDKGRHLIFKDRLNELIDALNKGKPPKHESTNECKYCKYRNTCLYKTLI